MALHVIVGAGPIGTATAEHLVDAGHRVRMVTRSGRGPDHPQIELATSDAADTERLTELTRGAATLYNCANPSRYYTWEKDWPPMAAAMLTAAERTGAGLVIMGNLYGYGPVSVPMTEDLPLIATTRKGRVRTKMWLDALAAHRAGRVRVTEARGSDYIGARANAIFPNLIAPAVIRGRRASAPMAYDVPHTFTFTGDAARLLATLGTDDRAWGRPWHVPSAPAVTARELATRLARLAGAPAPRLTTMPAGLVRVAGLFSRTIGATIEMSYQFTRPFVLDSSAAQETFGLKPTDLDDALRTLL